MSGTQQAADTLDRKLVAAEQQAEALAARVGDGSLSQDNYQQALVELVERDKAFFGAAIAFLPFAFDAERRLYAPYYSKQADSYEFKNIEESYDYADGRHEWFSEAITSGSRWSSPYFDKAVGDVLMTTYSAVVYQSNASGESEAVAVVTIDISIESMGDTVRIFETGKSGYLEIVNGEGVYLYSPTLSRVQNQDSLFDDSQWAKDSAFAQLRTLIQDNQSGLVKLYSPGQGKHEWVSATSLPSTPWHVVGVFAEPLEESHSAALRHRSMYIVLGVTLFLCVALLYKQVVPPAEDAILSWPTTVLVTLVLVVGVSQIWRITMHYASDSNREISPITSEQAVMRVVRDYKRRAADFSMKPPVVIPTGIYIESMKFLDTSDLQVVGGVWQKYQRGLDPSIERGFTLPGAARLRVSEPLVLPMEDYDLVRWQFSGDWRFQHQFTRFPLLKDDFSIGILPLDKASNVMLIPDVMSYSYLSPLKRPGLSPDVFLLGWRITDSSFELRPWQHNTTFGRPATLKSQALPEYYFAIGMEKVFVNSVFSNLTPLAIAMIIAFLVLLISTREKERLALMRTGVGSISVSAPASFLLSHCRI